MLKALYSFSSGNCRVSLQYKRHYFHILTFPELWRVVHVMASKSPRRNTVPKARNKPSFPLRKSLDGTDKTAIKEMQKIFYVFKMLRMSLRVTLYKSTRWWFCGLIIPGSYNINRPRRRKMG